MDTKLTKIMNNIVMGFGGQFVILALGIVIPRLVLLSFGSEINGLLSTVSQIFMYVALLEAGLGNATINSLYKPLSEGNRSSISEVLTATKKYYKRVSKYYFICVLLLAFIYPIIAKTEIDKVTIGLVILFQGLSGVVIFYFVATYKQLLVADGKSYIISNFSLLSRILSSIVKILLINAGYNIILIQFSFFIIDCIQVVGLLKFCHKRYPWLKFNTKSNMNLLSQRRAFMVHEISNVVFSSTDIFILSTFSSMKVASVYAIYNLVFSSIFSLISSANNGLGFILGQTFHQDKKKYLKFHDAYDSYYTAFVFAMISVAYVLILPFISIYTNGINDVGYIDGYLPIMFCVIQLLSCSRAVSAKLITIAGHVDDTQGRSISEALINLVISILLVQKIGIYGVLVGTIVALIYRTNDIIIYANRIILKRSPLKTYLNFLANSIIFTSVVFINSQINHAILTYIQLVECGLILSIFSLFTYFTVASLLNREAGLLLIVKMRQIRANVVK